MHQGSETVPVSDLLSKPGAAHPDPQAGDEAFPAVFLPGQRLFIHIGRKEIKDLPVRFLMPSVKTGPDTRFFGLRNSHGLLGQGQESRVGDIIISHGLVRQIPHPSRGEHVFFSFFHVFTFSGFKRGFFAAFFCD